MKTKLIRFLKFPLIMLYFALCFVVTIWIGIGVWWPTYAWTGKPGQLMVEWGDLATDNFLIRWMDKENER